MSRSQASLVSTTALLLALVGQGTALLHMGVVRHERCDEHGELVDVFAPRTAEPERQSDAAIGSDSAVHVADDHCVVAFRVAVVTDVDCVIDVANVAAIDARVVAGLAAADGVVARDVLDVAPKTSPPRT